MSPTSVSETSNISIMKKFFQKVGLFFVKIFGGLKKFEQFLQDHVDDAISIVSNIRLLVNHPAVITLMAVLPPKLQQAAQEAIDRIETILDKVIVELNIGQDCLQKETFAERLACFIAHIRELSPAMQEAAYLKIATLYTEQSSGAEVKRSVVDAIVANRFIDGKFNITAAA